MNSPDKFKPVGDPSDRRHAATSPSPGKERTGDGAEGPVLASAREKLLLFVIMALVLSFDQLTKYMIETRLVLGQVWAPLPALEPIFRVYHVSNTGAAFGIFQAGGPIFGILAVIVAAAIIYYNFSLPAGQKLLRVALGMQLGGALGNLLDRLRLGHVTDFLDFGPWPVFNLADTSIVAGVCILGWLVLQEGRQGTSATDSRGGENDPPAKQVHGPDPGSTLDEWSTS